MAAIKKRTAKPAKKAVAKSVNKPATNLKSAPPLAYKGAKTLAFDIGGSGLKASILDEDGKMLTQRVRVETPKPCPPKLLLEKFKELIAQLPPFDRVSVGFPGVVRHGRTLTAANLGGKIWHGYDLQGALRKLSGKPVIVINDADMQGLGAIKGEGVELVLTLGTGLGSALFEDGRLGPHIELAHIPFRAGETYEEQLGDRAYKKVGKKHWNRRLKLAIGYFRRLTHFDKLYLGGGNAENITLKCGEDVEIVSNTLGLRGGIWIWKDTNLTDGIQK